MLFFKSKKTKRLEEEIENLKKELDSVNSVVKQLHDTMCVLSAAQYQIGNDVGMIYSTLKSLASPSSSSLEDDLFSFKKDDDDKGYLN